MANIQFSTTSTHNTIISIASLFQGDDRALLTATAVDYLAGRGVGYVSPNISPRSACLIVRDGLAVNR